MKIKIKNYWLFILFAVLCFTCCLSFVLIGKNAEAQSSADNNIICEDNYGCYDIIDGATTGSCYPYDEISTLALDNKAKCNDYSSSHGPGRESGGVDILNVGCRNYMQYGFNYGSTDIAYWINMDSINKISDSQHRQQILSDIRDQTKMWNQAYMYDGTGQIVNIYEVNSNGSKPSSVNGNKVIEVLPYDLGSSYAGLFSPSERTVKLKYSNNERGYNVDTVVHEFGHVLGLNDIDSNNDVAYGTHKTLMGYSRGTTSETLSEAIKYQDVQGIAVATGRHVCQDSHFLRYVRVGSEYRHICFYCDRIDNRTSVIIGSQAMVSNENCKHNYEIMVSCGQRRWDKCTKCYNVIETSGFSGISADVTLHSEGNLTRDNVITVKYGEQLPELYAPELYGYPFDGYYDKDGKKYYGMEVKNDQATANIYGYDKAYVEFAVPVAGIVWDKFEDSTLYARWNTNNPYECDYPCMSYCGSKFIGGGNVHLKQGASKVSPASIKNYKFNHFTYDGVNYSANEPIPVRLYRGVNNTIHLDGVLKAYYDEDTCIAQGSLITLADGQQVAVENLTGKESLLVWNLYTGSYDVAPILFIDSDPLQLYEVINLYFSDGTEVRVISEHGFWDYDLNKYVFLDADAETYIGHWFNKGNERVRLVDVEIEEEYTTAWSPVTYGHLCYYVNGMLSMPGATEGFINIFEVGSETLKIDEELMQNDIETYGLYTYEEFAEIYPITEEIFEAFGGQYLKISIGKGLISLEQIGELINHYAEFLS